MIHDLDEAFDPERFRADGHALVDLLAEHLAGVRELPVLPWKTPDEMLAAWPIERAEQEGLGSLLARVVRESHHLHHGRYVGHQVTSPLPMAALCEMTGALLNNSMAVYEMGPVSTAMERRALQWMAARIGFGPGADGVLTSGGSAGNLTALLAARQARAGFDAWTQGGHAGPPLCVLASAQTHYSVQRAVQIMGWGADGAVQVPVDDRFKMRPDALAEAMREAERRGRKPIAVVASAGSTATGAYDPIDRVADFAEARGLWLHVDGAHGACAALSRAHREHVRGIERADSVVWDAHKMMLLPSLVTAVLFRDGARSYEAFRPQGVPYLFSDSAEAPWYDIGERTLECTKRMMSLGLYAAIALLGEPVFEAYVDRTFARARYLAERLRAAPDFELAVEPEANIVCFRYAPRGAADLDALQRRIRDAVVRKGSFYLVMTRLDAPRMHPGLFLRVTLVNPRTTEADLDALLEELRCCARNART